MDWSSIAGTLARIGLTGLGTAVGGPLGGVLGGAIGGKIADALGVDATPEAVTAALDADPETARAKLADLEGARQAEIALYRTEVEDRISARTAMTTLAQAGSQVEWTLPILSGAILSFYFVLIAALFLIPGDIPDRLYQLLTVAFGNVGTLVGVVVAFWFGSSRGSQRNGDAVRALATTAAAPTPGQIAGKAIDAVVGRGR